MKKITVLWNNKKGVLEANIKVVKGVATGDIQKLLDMATPYFVTVVFERYKAYGLPIPDKDDVISDVTVLILTHVVTFDPTKSSFKTYLYNIIRNRIYDMAFRGWASLTEPGKSLKVEYNSEHPEITGEQKYQED